MQGPSLTSPAFSFVQDVGKSAVDKCLRSFCFMLTVLRPNQQHKSYFSALPQWIPQNYLDVPTLPCYPLFQILPKSGGSHRDNHHFQRMITPERTYRPATHPIYFAVCFTRQNPSPVLRGRYFSFLGTYRGEAPPSCCARPFRCLKAPLGLSLLRCACKRKSAPWKFHEPSERDTGFSANAAAKQGQELRSAQTVTPLHEQHHLYLFLRLNNSETFVENAFWAQR